MSTYRVAAPAGKVEYLTVLLAGPGGAKSPAVEYSSTAAEHRLVIKTDSLSATVRLDRNGDARGSIKIADASGRVLADENLESKIVLPLAGVKKKS